LRQNLVCGGCCLLAVDLEVGIGFRSSGGGYGVSCTVCFGSWW
ncbi:hypothetical protein A2U01_0074205, partial [Trifolium medium]|nr:hypothetical protein [Trifolium medium]